MFYWNKYKVTCVHSHIWLYYPDFLIMSHRLNVATFTSDCNNFKLLFWQYGKSYVIGHLQKKSLYIYIPYIIKWFQRGYKKETHPWNPCLPITLIAVKGPYLVASKKCLFVCVYVLLGRACSLIKKRLKLKHNWVYLVNTKPYCLSWL